MKFILNALIIVYLCVLVQACGDGDPGPMAKQGNTHINSRAVRPFLSDETRQDGISEAHFRDNFSFNQFDKVDWQDPNTFGTSGSYVVPTTEDIPLIGDADKASITPQNYYSVSIIGDGECWLRAGIISVLYMVFNDQDLFELFVKQIPKVAAKYADVPGFKTRFYPDQFVELMRTLKEMSAQERLQQFNKEYVDKFLNYNFRALLHAYAYRSPYPTNDLNEKLKQLLTVVAWGSASKREVIWREFLPSAAIIFTNDFVTELDFIDGKDEKTIHILNMENLFNGSIKWANSAELREKFGIKDIRDFANTPFLEVIPIFVNSNHFNLAVRKSAAKKFGY